MTPCSKATIMIVLLSIYYVIKIDCLPLTWNQDTEQTPSSIPHPAHSGLAQFLLSFDSLLDRLMRVAQKKEPNIGGTNECARYRPLEVPLAPC